MNLTVYEKKQSYNFLTRWLHSVRYRHIVKVVEELAATRNPSEVIRILDIGCGPAKLYGLLNERFSISYVGCEIYSVFVDAAQSRYGNQSNFQLTSRSITSGEVSLEGYDMIVALETLEHIPEHDVVRLVESIAKAKPKVFVYSVPVELGPAIWLKNVGAWIGGYSRYKEYSWKQTFWAGCYQQDKIPLHDIGHIGFDWRWLAQTVRHNMKIVKFRRFPVNWLPAAASSSIFLVARPKD